MNRGARRAQIFKRPEDCQGFLDHLYRSVSRTGVEIHAYALMPNHYHLLVRSPLGTLSRAMQLLNGGYSLWLNKRHEWDGPLFKGRFTSVLITDPSHLDYLLAYIHLNPLRAHLVPRLTDQAWTSHLAYLGRDRVPEWLTCDHFLEVLDGPNGVHTFVRKVHQGRARWPEDLDRETAFPIRHRQETPLDLSARATAEDVPSQSLEALLVRISHHCGVSVQDLLTVVLGPRANPARRFAVWAFSHQTHHTRTTIAETLGMPPGQALRLLQHLRRETPPEPLATWMSAWVARTA